jgi:nucleotide-binding universal stress UspA family protein
MTTVLIAIDDTKESSRAAQVAVDCFGPGADYLAIYVDQERPVAGPLWGPDVIWGGIYTYPGLYSYPVSGSPVTRSPRETTDALAGNTQHAEVEAERLATAAGVDAEPLGDIGDPGTAIAEAAREHDVDVIVVGSHHRNWFERLLHGSTSDDVLKEADVPVMIVPAEYTADDD